MEPYQSHRRSDSRQARQAGATVPGTRVWVYAALFLMLLTVAAPLGLAWAQEAPAGGATEYRDIPGLGSRNLIWIIAQQPLQRSPIAFPRPALPPLAVARLVAQDSWMARADWAREGHSSRRRAKRIVPFEPNAARRSPWLPFSMLRSAARPGS